MSQEILDDFDYEFNNSGDFSDEEMEEYLRIFIGKNADDYIQFYKDKKIFSFHFLKMMIGVPWLLYRKMYAQFLTVLLFYYGLVKFINIVFIVPIFGLFYFFLFRSEEIVLLMLVLLIMFVLGFLNNKIYLQYCRIEIKRIKSKSNSQHQFISNLENKGGVEGAIPSIVLFGLLIYLMTSLSEGMNPILIF